MRGKTFPNWCEQQLSYMQYRASCQCKTAKFRSQERGSCDNSIASIISQAYVAFIKVCIIAEILLEELLYSYA